ncbi:unnamed protein product [Gongylonema pulchrum]|uniref:Cyclic nucleotide-binding domain-containing protein n=1 Tax=Gongylonema pulchrum TaxID=637853 RepID=A0A3P7MPK2_9BILA|nr:unnamed protein product [Gongylonema pulchrum]
MQKNEITFHNVSVRALTPCRVVRHAADFSDVNDCLATAHRWFAEVLQLGTSSEAIALFENRLLIENVPEKHLIVEQNAEEEQLIMILSGVLEISQEPIDGEDEAVDDEHVFLYPRELVGGLQLLTGEPWFYTVRSHTAATYATISKKNFFESVS